MAKKWYKKWWAILLFIFLTLIFALTLFAVFYIYKEVKNYQVTNNSESAENPEEQIIYQLQQQKKYSEPEGKNNLNFYLGTSTPLVKIVEFSGFNCPNSKNSYSEIRKLSLKYPDKIQIIFRHFPANEESLKLSLASYCAGEQGAFWPMHDKLFQNQGQISSQDTLFLAKQIGVDPKLFEKCLASNKYEDEILADIKDAEKMNIQGTPTWFFNGYKIEGSIPYDLMEMIVLALIKENK